ncbi:MAG: S41 family peptidase [Phycisphaerae bacterium]|nr:S41 family peptidase [Phycisphaerae bacterium]
MQRNNFYFFVLLLAIILTTLNYMLYRTTISRAEDYSSIMRVSELIEQNYVSPLDKEKMVTDAINGIITQNLDKYSCFFSAKQIEQYDKNINNEYKGIGVQISVINNELTVIMPFKNSPAMAAGVLPGDVILEIDGESSLGWNTSKAAEKLSGPGSIEVVMKIRHPDNSEEVVKIQREKIHAPTIQGWKSDENDWQYMLDENEKIGYIQISQFVDGTTQDFLKEYNKLATEGMKALIMDLRSNPGGSLTEACSLVDKFLPGGTIITTRGRAIDQAHHASVEGTLPDIPLVILANSESASASEIVAGALQDHKRATVVGLRTYGKGLIQSVYELPDANLTTLAGVLKITTAYYYLPNGRCVQRIEGSDTWGVEPDVEVDIASDNVISLIALRAKLLGFPFEKMIKAFDNPELKVMTETDDFENIKKYDDQLNEALKQCQILLAKEQPVKTAA